MNTFNRQTLKIGWAMRDVSTDQPVGIRGQFYLRLSEGVMDPVTVTALALDNGDDAIIFLACDTVIIQSFMVKMIRERVQQTAPDIPTKKIIINATHAHTGGDLFDFKDEFPCDLPRMPGAEYQQFFAERAADAIIEAWQNRQSGKVAWGLGYAVTGYSRRTVYFDDISTRPGKVDRPGLMANGHAAMYGNTNDPQFSHFEAGADPFVNFLYTFNPDGTLTGAIINVPCPSQCAANEWKLTADYWHEVRQNLKEKYGDIFVLPQCAAAGDLSPTILHNKKAHQRRLELKGTTPRQEIADRITAAFTEVLEWASKDCRSELSLKHEIRTIMLAKRRITRKEYEDEQANLAKLNEKEFAGDGTPQERLRHDSILAAQRRRCQAVIKRYETQDAEPKLPMELHVARLGNIAFAGNRFELFMDYMHRIQAQSPAEQTFIIQLTGSETGDGGGSYLATQRAAEGKGYSATQYCNLVSPDGGQELVEQTLTILHELWENDT